MMKNAYANFLTISKVQSYKLYNNKYMIASTQITDIEIFAFTAAPVFRSLSRKVFLLIEKTIETVKNYRLLFKKLANFTGKLQQNYK